MSNFIVNMYV